MRKWLCKTTIIVKFKNWSMSRDPPGVKMPAHPSWIMRVPRRHPTLLSIRPSWLTCSCMNWSPPLKKYWILIREWLCPNMLAWWSISITPQTSSSENLRRKALRERRIMILHAPSLLPVSSSRVSKKIWGVNLRIPNKLKWHLPIVNGSNMKLGLSWVRPSESSSMQRAAARIWIENW